MEILPAVPVKAVVPAAGVGRRLLPVSRAVPKEMFPIGRYPAIEWVVAEAVASGCTEVAIVISPQKQMIRDYFTTACPDLPGSCRLTFIVQPEPRGLGHALWLAREFCDGLPFAVLLPDDLVDGPELPLLQMAAAFGAHGGAVMAMAREPAKRASLYGRLQLKRVSGRLHAIEAILARATPATTATLFLGVGRCLFTAEVLDHAGRLLDQPPAEELDDAMIFQRMLAHGGPVHGLHLKGRRYDIATPDGYVAAWRRFGREKPTWKSH